MDIEILLFLQNIREALGGALNTFMVFISSIAVDYYIMIPAFILFWTVDKKKASRVLLTWGSSLCLGSFTKATFCVYRPWIRDPRVQPPQEIFAGATGYSFPSGHSFSSGGFWNSLALAYKENKKLVRFAVVMVAITMFSRIFLGVHTPQDILVGCAISLICAFGVSKLYDWIEMHPEKDWILLAAATVIAAALLCYLKFKTYPMDYVDGTLLVDPKKMTVDGFKDPGVFYGIVMGWFLERRFVRFSTEVSTQQKVMRALVGGLITVFWYTAVAIPIGKAAGSGIVHFITMASTPIICMVVYPLLFTIFERRENRR